MLITPFEIAQEPLALDVRFPVDAIEYTPDVQQATPLALRGTADLLLEHRGHKEVVEDIRLRAEYEGEFELLCARCLDPVPQHLEGSFDLIFRPADADLDSGERSISEEETEIGYYDKGGLVLEDVVREQVLLALPNRSLCRPDCAGLCQHCGANLNTDACTCDKASADLRWSALAGLSSKLPS